MWLNASTLVQGFQVSVFIEVVLPLGRSNECRWLPECGNHSKHKRNQLASVTFQPSGLKTLGTYVRHVVLVHHGFEFPDKLPYGRTNIALHVAHRRLNHTN